VADSLESLAHLYEAKGDVKQAEQALTDALEIWKAKFGPEHPAVARGLASLGELQVSTGRFDEAEKHLVRAREIRAAKLGADHPDTAESIHQLGLLAYARRDYKKAEPLFRQAVQLRQKKLGASHVQVAVSYSYLASTLVALDKGAEAVAAFTEAQRISEQLVRNVGTTSTESRLEALLRFMRAQEEVVYSLLSEPKLAKQAAPLALSVALLRKGRSVDEAAAASRAMHGDLPPEQQAMAEELRALRSEIAFKKLSTSASGKTDVEKENARAEQLEQELARVSAAYRNRQPLPASGHITKKVASALGDDGVLVEVLAYRRYDFRAQAKAPRWGSVRYAALVLNGKGHVSSVELGQQGEIDKNVNALLKEITGEHTQSREGADKLAKAVVAPLVPLIGGAKRVFLSLDGQLNLVPFWALPDGDQLLIDKWELVYLTSGRDLLRKPSKDAASTVAIMAKPDFVKGAAAVADDTRGLELVEAADQGQGQSREAFDKKGDGGMRLKYPPSPLIGTAQEARAIRKLIPKAKIMMGADATKQQLLGLESPGVLHVATHGLFKPEPTSLSNSRGLSVVEAGFGGAAGPKGGDPLLSSMLLMANAGHMMPGDKQGVVLDPNGLATALEMAGMNLWGTQLVVLSACESGRGQVDSLGQGVYGLRRALVVAGAETLVTSLWKVDDEVTRDMMTQYYRNLLKGQGRVEALRTAAQAIRAKHPDPRHWAPFIAIGQVGPLRGVGSK
jgi:CHAT domain-containing protein